MNWLDKSEKGIGLTTSEKLFLLFFGGMYLAITITVVALISVIVVVMS